MPAKRILVVRLGAMGDVIHALPAVASLKRGWPDSEIFWAIHPRWVSLLADNPDIAGVVPVDRKQWATVRTAMRRFRTLGIDLAVDFQGLLQSAAVAWLSGANSRAGFTKEQARESLAARLYTQRVSATASHVVDRNLELAEACGGLPGPVEFKLGHGQSEGTLPEQPFVLGCPLAGWTSKQWPREYWTSLAFQLTKSGMTLVVNAAPESRVELECVEGAVVYCSGIPGLIHATCRAAAVVGVDSGPIHLAAALGKKGVAIFGPTDPSRNGPYGGTIRVLRDSSATTSYKRASTVDDSMRAVAPLTVLQALRQML